MLDKVVRDLFHGGDRPQRRRIGTVRTPAKSRRPNFALEILEPRLLLSADPVTSINDQNQLSVTFADADDAVVIDQAGDAQSANGGFIVTLTYGGAQHTFGDATTGITSLALDLAGGDDSVQLSQDPISIPISVIGGSGDDRLIGPDAASDWLLGNTAGSGSVSVGPGPAVVFDGIETLRGGTGDDTLTGADVATDWVLSGAGSGTVSSAGSGTAAIVFEGFEALRGGADDDAFKLDPGGSVGTIDGGGGNDALVGDNVDNAWAIQGSNHGTLNGSVTFTSVENLIGGTANDTFIFADGAAITGVIDAGGEADDNGDGELTPDELAIDTIDYSAYAAPVTVDLGAGTATGTSGFLNVDVFAGGSSGADRILGPSGPSVIWTVTGPDEVSVANISFSGFENLIGASRVGVNEVVSQYDLQLMAWGDGSTAPTSGKNLIVVGTATDLDNVFHLHVRIFDARGDRVADVDSTNAAANSNLEQILPSLLPPHVLTVAEKTQVINELTPLVGSVLLKDNSDAFVIEGPGSISGTIDGGTGGNDGLIFIDPADEDTSQIFNPAGADSSGTATVFSKSITYVGLDHVNFVNNSDPLNPIITGTIFNDSIRVYANPDVEGGLKIRILRADHHARSAAGHGPAVSAH